MFVIDFQPVKDLRVAGKWVYIISVTDKYMSSQVRAGRFKGVENRGVADMPRSGESLRFVDQQTIFAM